MLDREFKRAFLIGWACGMFVAGLMVLVIGVWLLVAN